MGRLHGDAGPRARGGFGGLELATMLSEALGDDVEVTLIDKNDAFVFGYSKLDVMFGRTTPDAVRLPYRDIAKPGVRFLQETITAIDPEARRVTTDGGVHEADVLVVALGADYDLDATPGLAEGGNEFYSVAGAERLGELLPTFSQGRAIVGVCGAPFKCPPAPSEAALLLHDYLSARGVRDDCEISFVIPFGSPVPPSPETSRGAARRLRRARHRVRPRPPRQLARPGTPRRRARRRQRDALRPLPRRPEAPRPRRGRGERHDRGRLRAGEPEDARDAVPGRVRGRGRRDVGVPKAGVFAEGAARVVAASLIARVRGGEQPAAYDGLGSCYIEFGAGRVGRVDVDFLSGPKPTGTFHEPSAALVAEKEHFGSSRRARWFGS